MARESYLVRLSREARRRRLQQLLAELAEELREMDKLQSRVALTLARIKLLLELEKRDREA